MKMLAHRVICCGDYRSYLVLSEAIDRINADNTNLPPIRYRVSSGETDPTREGVRYTEIAAHSPARLAHLEDYLGDLSDKAKSLEALFKGEEIPKEDKSIEEAVNGLFDIFLGKKPNPHDEVNHSDDNH